MSDLRQKISAAAQALYLEEGIDGISMRKIADRVGVSAPAIYRHFENKEAVLDEIVVEGLRILEGHLTPALDAPTSEERLRQMIDNYLAFALQQPRYFDFAFLTPSRDIDRFDDELSKPHLETFRMAMDVVAACIEDGTFAPGDSLEIGIMVWAEVHGLVTLYRTGRFGPDETTFREIYRRSVNRMLDGLRTSRAEA